MREILFRGKTEKGEWVQGVPFFEEERCYIIEDLFICDEYACTGAVNSMVLPKTVGQYTGLIDKHGTKIFEGDVIKQTFYLKQTNGCLEREYITSIEYGISYAYSDVCGVCQRFRDGSGIAMVSVMDQSGIVDCEVIGNIHDNPKLMNEREGEQK